VKKGGQVATFIVVLALIALCAPLAWPAFVTIGRYLADWHAARREGQS
jgi:hypothetical protein